MARGGGFERTARVASLVQQVLAELIQFEVKDPRVALVTVTDVEVTGDLREAKVFYYVTGDDRARDDAADGLDRASGFLRHELGQRIRLRTTPELHFEFDDSLDRGARIEEKLRELGLGDAAVDEPGETEPPGDDGTP